MSNILASILNSIYRTAVRLAQWLRWLLQLAAGWLLAGVGCWQVEVKSVVCKGRGPRFACAGTAHGKVVGLKEMDAEKVTSLPQFRSHSLTTFVAWLWVRWTSGR